MTGSAEFQRRSTSRIVGCEKQRVEPGKQRLVAGLAFSRFVANAAQSTGVDENVDEGVAVGDGGLVAQVWALDAEFFSLGVDALGGGALLVDALVVIALAVELVADAGALGSREGGETTAFGPALVIDGAGLTAGLGQQERTGITSAFMFQQALL